MTQRTTVPSLFLSVKEVGRNVDAIIKSSSDIRLIDGIVGPIIRDTDLAKCPPPIEFIRFCLALAKGLSTTGWAQSNVNEANNLISTLISGIAAGRGWMGMGSTQSPLSKEPYLLFKTKAYSIYCSINKYCFETVSAPPPPRPLVVAMEEDFTPNIPSTTTTSTSPSTTTTTTTSSGNLTLDETVSLNSLLPPARGSRKHRKKSDDQKDQKD